MRVAPSFGLRMVAATATSHDAMGSQHRPPQPGRSRAEGTARALSKSRGVGHEQTTTRSAGVRLLRGAYTRPVAQQRDAARKDVKTHPLMRRLRSAWGRQGAGYAGLQPSTKRSLIGCFRSRSLQPKRLRASWPRKRNLRRNLKQPKNNLPIGSKENP